MNDKYYEALMLEMDEIKRQLAAMSPPPQAQTTSENRHALSFTEKEIMKMPKKVRKVFRIDGHVVRYRERKTGRYNCSYEIRYAKRPYNDPPISVSATSLQEAKERFIEKLNNYTPNDPAAPVVPKDFHGFAMYWFENFHKRKVGEKTYRNDLGDYRRNLEKKFGKRKFSDIAPVEIQVFLDSYSDKGRTKESVHSLLNQIAKCAVKHGIISSNPLDMCFYAKHEREHGIALTKDEEKKLLAAYVGTEYELDFAVILYTGLRPNEYKKIHIEGEFVVKQNSKRKNGKVEIRKIPITPMLRPYIQGVKELHLHCLDAITNRLKKVLPNHKLYDLRTTFQTRCTECYISDVAIGLFMGNGIGSELKKAYTDVSDEWLFAEGQKLNY